MTDITNDAYLLMVYQDFDNIIVTPSFAIQDKTNIADTIDSALKDKKESYTTLDNDYSLLKRFLLDLYN